MKINEVKTNSSLLQVSLPEESLESFYGFELVLWGRISFDNL